MDARSFYTQIPRILPQTEQNRFFILACILYAGENDQALCPLYRKSENRNEPKTVEHEKFFVVAGMIKEEDGRLRRENIPHVPTIMIHTLLSPPLGRGRETLLHFYSLKKLQSTNKIRSLHVQLSPLFIKEAYQFIDAEHHMLLFAGLFLCCQHFFQPLQ